MALYAKAPKRERDMLAATVHKHHPELAEAGVEYDLLMALARTDEAGEPVGVALSAAGYPAVAKCRPLPLKDRVAGRADVEIILDGDRWNDWDTEVQEAILDHELTHCELCVGDDGRAKRDDANRPKVRMRKHDHQFGWFDSVVRRHGEASIEWQQFEQFKAVAYEQLWLPGMEEAVV